mmetsp:Transcript_22934/g.77425  ORF Transcript_22934/g.77425 Transcript_22934/m.77425 type:complete len:207 (-) Transcript_22934:268-888(-)
MEAAQNFQKHLSGRCTRDAFTLTISHLQSPIFYLATVAAGSNLQPPFSIFDLTSGADGWALGSTICILHLLSLHLGPCCCSAIYNPQSQSSIFSLEWGTGQEGSTGETWACPCERSARISSLNLLSLPQRSTGLAQRFPLLHLRPSGVPETAKRYLSFPRRCGSGARCQGDKVLDGPAAAHVELVFTHALQLHVQLERLAATMLPA